MGLATKTLIGHAEARLREALEVLGDVKATGEQLRALNVVYENIQGAIAAHQEIFNRNAA